MDEDEDSHTPGAFSAKHQNHAQNHNLRQRFKLEPHKSSPTGPVSSGQSATARMQPKSNGKQQNLKPPGWCTFCHATSHNTNDCFRLKASILDQLVADIKVVRLSLMHADIISTDLDDDLTSLRTKAQLFEQLVRDKQIAVTENDGAMHVEVISELPVESSKNHTPVHNETTKAVQQLVDIDGATFQSDQFATYSCSEESAHLASNAHEYQADVGQNSTESRIHDSFRVKSTTATTSTKCSQDNESDSDEGYATLNPPGWEPKSPDFHHGYKPTNPVSGKSKGCITISWTHFLIVAVCLGLGVFAWIGSSFLYGGISEKQAHSYFASPVGTKFNDFLQYIHIVDSGATITMLNYREAFFKYKAVNELVQVAKSGSTMHATGRGIARLHTFSDTGDPICLDVEALYVPELDKNLVSSSWLYKNGYEVLFRQSEIPAIRTPLGQSIPMTLIKGLWYIPSVDTTTNIPVRPRDDLELWHHSMGCCPLNVLVKTSHAVQGMESIQSRSVPIGFDCSTCNESKAHRSPTRAANFQRASQPLEMVYMDGFGPISTAAIGNQATYGVIFDDCYSGANFTYLMRSKDQIYPVLIFECSTSSTISIAMLASR